MPRIPSAFAVLLCLVSAPVHAQDAAAALTAICDQAAASPIDGNRPAGVAGVASDKVDPKIAIPACEAAAKAAPNDPRILFQLGRAYFAAKAYESARTYYAKADEIGYPLATNNLAALYNEGLGVVADPARGIVLLKKAADGGAPIAMYNVGIKYRDGKGVGKDAAAAREWLRKAGELGHAQALTSYGLMLEYGEGGAKDFVEARKSYRYAAELGDPTGLTNYGFSLYNGFGGEKNLIEARRWFKKAAEVGEPRGMAAFGYILDVGKGGPTDIAAARYWYEKAAAAGNGWAMNNLGVLYGNGEGVQRDLAEARRWYEKARNSGDVEAAKLATENLALLDQPQRRSSRRRSGGSYQSYDDNGPQPFKPPQLFLYNNGSVSPAPSQGGQLGAPLPPF